MKGKSIISLLAVLTLSAGLVACSGGSGGDKSTPPPTAQQTEKPAETPATESAGTPSAESAETPTTEPAETPATEPAEEAATESAVNEPAAAPVVEVDGKSLEVKANPVACTEASGTMNISTASGIGAIFTVGEAPKVQSVGVTAVDGITFAWTEGVPGSAEVKQNGKTYEITGKAMVTDMNNPGVPAEKSFRVALTCP